MTQTALMDSISKRKSGVVELITYEIYKHITWYKFYVTVLIKNQNLLISGFVGRTCSRRRSRGTGRHQEEGDIRVSSVSAVGVVANAGQVQEEVHRHQGVRLHQRKSLWRSWEAPLKIFLSKPVSLKSLGFSTLD